ncbi:hypothetical protein [Roseobacter sinensis]|uniref:Uncharacterized protein n=1 Tax=Roseobacter sinensis TaxID=2931391 RepID=A0ABT3BEN5_9RHOB|nr:hypothetical protein [Roseobacter sp. WL0113]MCV3272032.1 hypothetical protein [Roseobacter sp. WL0113]
MKISILLIALCAGLAALASTLLARGDLAAKTQSIFDAAFASKISDEISNPILRVRNGSETFCIQEHSGAAFPPSRIVSDMAEAFELGWTQVLVDDLADCPTDSTTFYVVQGERPDQSELLDVMERIVGSGPPNPDELFPEWALGLSVDLPGSRHRSFTFSTFADDMPQEVARSIMTEELIQSILRASDVETTEIVSLLGEDLRNKDYSQWFHNNPIGLCSVDIVLLELLLGPSTSGLHKMEQMRAHLRTEFDALLAAAATRAQHLSEYRDDRCWVWETT